MNKPIHRSATSGIGRAVIYARYSSEHQREASIEDQVRTCKARIEAEGWTLVATYTDYAESGASHLRPGYQKLLADARSGSFDVAVAEALDRLSRDQEHVAALFKHLSFAGVKIITLAEGEIGALHVGLKGTMNAELTAQLRRALKARSQDRNRNAGGGNMCADIVTNVSWSAACAIVDRGEAFKSPTLVRPAADDARFLHPSPRHSARLGRSTSRKLASSSATPTGRRSRTSISRTSRGAARPLCARTVLRAAST